MSSRRGNGWSLWSVDGEAPGDRRPGTARPLCNAGSMKFGFEQRWTTTVEQVVDLYLDEDFWRTATGFGKTSAPNVLEVTRDG